MIFLASLALANFTLAVTNFSTAPTASIACVLFGIPAAWGAWLDVTGGWK